MTQDLTFAGPGRLIALDRSADTLPVTAAERIASWLDGLGPNTRRAYTRDLLRFADWIGEDGIGDALGRLIAAPRARALLIVEQYRDALKARGAASATINRRLSALNSALRQIGRADIGPGRLDIELVSHEPRRDVRGPSVGRVARVLEELSAQCGPLAKRDLAIIRLAAQRGLRRSEIVGLTLADLRLEDGEILVTRKGKRERVAVRLPQACVVAIRDWLVIRATVATAADPALFIGLGAAGRGTGISADCVRRIVIRHGSKVGGEGWRPHGLRHTAITQVLHRTANVETARVFAGHAALATTQRYLDGSRELETAAIAAIDSAF